LPATRNTAGKRSVETWGARMEYSRRGFGKVLLGGIPVAAAMASGQRLLVGSEAATQEAQTPAVLSRRGAGCIDGDFSSRFAGVQIGSIVFYSYRQMPSLGVRSLLSYLTENGINGCEMECAAAEKFAGAPPAAYSMLSMLRTLSQPAGRGGSGTANQSQMSPAQLAAIQAWMKKSEAALPEVNKWRASVPMTKFEEIRRMYADQGVSIYAYKLEPVYDSFPDSAFEYAFNVAKALGADQVTMEMPGTGGIASLMGHGGFELDSALTKRIGQLAARYKVMVAYHAHEQASPTLWDVPMAQSEYNGINLDVGHYVAAGNRDVVEFIRKNHARIGSLHLKDRCYPNHNHGSNEAWGQGDTPLKGILQLMRDEHYRFPASIELEYDIPEGSNPVIESGRCVAWAKNVLLSNGPEIAATA
jgi:sugar phosphate isomerase/epimerase